MQGPPNRTTRRNPPFPFILEALEPLGPLVRPMFGGFAVYLGDRVVCMLRLSAKGPEDNGLWIVLSETADPADPDLRRELPSLRPIARFQGKIRHWLLLPADGQDFEREGLRVCELLLARDPRLGRIPESRRRS